MSSLVEVRHLVAADVRSCSVWSSHRPDVTDRWLFLPQTCGGAIAITHHNSPRCLTWHLDSHSESNLLLQVADLATGPVAPAVQLAVSELLFPGVAAGVHNGHVWLCLLTSSKSILYLQLPINSSGSSSSSLTSVLLPERNAAITRYSGQLFAPQQLSEVGTPTSMTIAQGHLVITGTTDNLMAMPLASLAAGAAADLQKQPISTNVLRGLLGNLVSSASSGAAAVLPLSDAATGRQAALLLHQDGSFRCMDLVKKSTLFKLDPLEPSHGSSWGAHRPRDLAPTTAVLAHGSSSKSSCGSWVVWQMDPPEGSAGTLVGALQVALPPEATSWQRSTHVREVALALPVTKARVVDAAVAGTQLLLLLSVPGAPPRVCAYSSSSGELLGEVEALHGSGPRAWGVHQDLWRTILQCFPSEASPGTSVTERLVTPGQLCLPSLAATLCFWGGSITPQQLQAASVRELKVLLEAAAAAIQGRHPSYDTYECWQALFDKYCEMWDQQHGLLALLPPCGQWAGCYRSGGLLSLLRPQAALEARRGGAGVAGSGVGQAWERGVVRQCLGVVRELLGGPCMTLLTQLVMSGLPLAEVAPPFLELLLRGPSLAPTASGPLDTSTSPRTKARQQRLEGWQAGRGGRLMQVQQALAGLEEPLSIIGDYVSDWGRNLANSVATAAAAAAAAAGLAGVAAQPSSTTGLPPALGLTLTSVTRQLARAACQELQALALLLLYLLRHGSAGGQQLLANEAAEVEQELLPRVTEQLKVAAMVMWLCRTPAEVPPAAAAAGGGGQGQQQLGVGPLLDLQMPGTASRGGSRAPSAARHHTPSGGSGRAPGGSSSSSTGGNLQPMAVHFLDAFCSGQPAAVQQAMQGDVAGAALQLLLYLMGGFSGQQQWLEEGAPGAADTAVRLAYVLFLVREYRAVAAVVNIAAGGQLEDPGLRCMLGLSMVAGRPSQSAATAADAEVLQEAQQHLLAATPGLHAGALHEVLVKLLRRLGGSTLATAEQLLGPVSTWRQADAPEPLHAAAYSLVFSEVVMKLFEDVGCYSGALAFAAASHDLLPSVFVPSAADAAEAQAKAGELSSFIFKYACELGDWQRAYEAVAGNVVDERKLDDTQRLVGRLVEAGARQVLCRLPWEGSVVRSAGPEEYQLEAVPLRQVVVEALERQALYADPGAVVPRYQLAADFLLTWNEWRTAAAAHLGLARRLRASGVQDGATLAAVQAAYDSAQLLLACVPQQDAWLDVAGCRLLAAQPAPDDKAAGTGLALLFHSGDNQDEDVSMQGDQDGPGEGSSGHGLSEGLMRLTHQQLQQMADSQVVTLRSLQREAARFTAALAALQQVPDLRMLRRSPEDAYLLQLLLTGRRYEAALQLAAAVWSGPQLEGQLEGVASAMAVEACQLQAGLTGLDAAGSSSSSWGAGSACGALGGPAAGAWQQLQDLLQWCDLNLSPSDPADGGSGRGDAAGQPPSLVGGRLRIAAINTLLTQQPALELPAWLTDCFKPRLAAGGMAGSAADPAALLRVYLQHGRLLEAGDLVLEHLAGWAAVRPLERTKSSATVWLPLHTIQQLLGALEGVKEGWGAGGAGGGDPRALQAAAEAVDELAERLRRGLQTHVSLVAEDSLKAAGAAAAAR